MEIKVVVRGRFSAVHCWPECPLVEVLYLRNPHRHEFHYELKFLVDHQDRDVEFIKIKDGVHKYVQQVWEGKNLGKMSCEMMAVGLAGKFGACFASVFEDGENGAEVIP